MIKTARRAFRQSVDRVLSQRSRRASLRGLARVLGVNPLDLAYEDRGILQYQNDVVSGESHFVRKVLPRFLAEKTDRAPVLFDVGANVGAYSLMLREALPTAIIFAFEPNVKSYERLAESAKSARYHSHNLGFSDKSGSATIYTSTAELTSAHASMYAEVLSDLHGYSSVQELEFRLSTIDSFCEQHSIDHIALLKIDTEGHEFSVLKGAAGLLKRQAISMIQFEFNEMNVISRVFFKDFFALLSPQFDLYRMRRNDLLPLPVYTPADEIFLFHNIVAIQRSLNSGFQPELWK